MKYLRHSRSMALSLLVLAVLATLLVDSVVVSADGNIFLRWGDRRLLNIAHAGAASIAPQNTIIAGEKALAVGADLWGIDTRLTRDGVFILMHDATLTRTTNAAEVFPDRGPWEVKDFTLKEIERLDAGGWFLRDDPFGQIAAGSVPAEDQQAYVGVKVPTLREALLFTREHNWRMDIEVKAMDYVTAAEIADKLVALIHATGMEDRVMASSFDTKILRAVKEIDSKVPTAALVILPPLDAASFLADLGADGYEPSPVAFSSHLAQDLVVQGYGVYVWTYNDQEKLRSLAQDPGVTGIYTDFPQRLHSILVELHDGEQDR